ncbi:MAG: DUF4832 domain-containing protein [Armatimonadetes bacterium]|nr:DUF4832 domain-containing protein [Armatimonadota bacterium]CUU35149.1 Beta-galactosidase [Armatimonadetes bacterium DC]
MQKIQRPKTVVFSAAPGPLDNPLKGWAPYWFSWLTQYYLPVSMNFWYVSWRELEPNPNDYRFEQWEQRWDTNLTRNNHVVFRVYLDYPGQPTGVPQWLIDMGVEMRPYTEYGGGLSPDYDDPRLVQALVRLIRALGQRYNNHPRVAFVQLGFLGFWGEWHTYPRTELFASEATQRTVVDEMRAAFPNKILQARTANGYLGQHPWLGYHDDMFPEDTDGGEAWHFLPTLRRAGRDQNWKVACIGGEMVPNQALRLMTTDWDLTRTMTERAHITYLGPYCPPLEDHRSNSTFMNNSRTMVRMMGYEYRLKELRYTPEVRRGSRIELALFGVNQGVAPFYYPWEVRMGLMNTANQVIWSWRVAVDIRRWLPGEFIMRTVSPIVSLPKGEYRLVLGIIDPWRNQPRVRFANNFAVINSWNVLAPLRIP